MRMRTVFAIVLTMFALPAVAGELPPVMPAPRALPIAPPPAAPGANPDLDVCFEVRTIKVPVGFCERVGLKLTGDTVLTDAELTRILGAAQEHRDATVTQFPKVTAFDGQEATVKNCETQLFVTGGEIVRVGGQPAFIPQNKPIELGDTLTVRGHVLADLKRVSVRATFTRKVLVGDVPLVPIVTQITPVFEGGSQGKPIPFTQFLQAPDVKTDKVEKNAVAPSGGTIVLGSWKETGERPAKGKGAVKKATPAAEYEVVALATVRVGGADRAAAPTPRELPARVTKIFTVDDIVVPVKPGAGPAIGENGDRLVKLVTDMVRPYSWVESGGRGTAEFFNIGSSLVVTNTPDAVNEVSDLLEALRRLKEYRAVPMPHAAQPAPADQVYAYKLQRVPAADAVVVVNGFLTEKHLTARVTADLAFNNVVVSAAPALQKQIGDMIAKLDENPPPTRLNQTVRLKNIAAADAAEAVNTFLTSKKLMNVVVVAEPATNTVLVSAEPAVFHQTIEMLAALDKAPVQVMVQALVIQVPRGSAIKQWLTEDGRSGASSWTLTTREVKTLNTMLREAKSRDECDILSRPQIQMADNQTGFVQVGQNFPVQTAAAVKSADGKVATQPKVEFVPRGFSMRLTPRVSPDGKSVLLRAEPQVTTVSVVDLKHGKPGEEAVTPTPVPAFNTQSVSSTSEVRIGESLVIGMSGEKYETLIVLTPHIVRSEADGARVLSDDAAKMKWSLPK